MLNEETLSRWANAPAASKFKHTHEEVRKALAKYLAPFAKQNHNYTISQENYEVYLQGSYANSTNISDSSDVDIVVQLNKVFGYDLSQIPSEQKNSFHLAYPDEAVYTFVQFKEDVYHSLQQYFNKTNGIKYSKKCIKIPKNSYRVNADVIPAFEHRKYGRFISRTPDEYVRGIKFYNTDTSELIINFPKEHLDNCESLNVDTDGKFKDAVRIFKNINKYLTENGHISEDTACSYYIENLLFNCPSNVFNGSYQQIVAKILQNFLDDINNGSLISYKCANGQDMLFQGGKNWNFEKALTFINASGSLFIGQI